MCHTQGASPHETEPSVFGRYAAQWFPPMVDALVGHLYRQPEEAGIHYLLLDACVTFLTWPALFATPPGGANGSAAQLLRYLVGTPPTCWSPSCKASVNFYKAFLVARMQPLALGAVQTCRLHPADHLATASGILGFFYSRWRRHTAKSQPCSATTWAC